MPDPKRTMRAVLLPMICSVIFLDFWVYSEMHRRTPDVWTDVLRGTADAPAQYRVGVLFAADWLTRHAPLRLHHALALIDFLSALIAAAVLSSLFLRSDIYRRGGRIVQWFGASVFCLVMLNYLLWLTWYLRPETLANAALLSLTVLLLTVKLPFGGRAGQILTVIGLVILAALGGVVRADIPAALHAGVLLVLLIPQLRARGAADGFALPRGLQMLTSIACGLVAGGCQFYLMHVRYPNATYGKTPTVMLWNNFMGGYQWIVLVIALFPWLWTAKRLLLRKAHADAPSQALFAGSLIFFALWMTLGRMEEIRIFLPYALALVPLTATTAMEFIAGSEAVDA